VPIVYLGSRRKNSIDNELITSTTADIPAQPLADLCFARIRASLKQCDGSHKETRRTIAALQRVVLFECPLHRVQTAVAGEPFNSPDRSASCLSRKRQAGSSKLAIY